jgi:hypothetical protein
VSDKRPADPNATIQIDLSQIQLEDIVVPSAPANDDGAGGDSARRSLPPPLPPVLPIVSVPPEPTKGRKVAMIGLFAVLLVAAIVAGLMVGAHVRGTPSADGAPPVAS